MRFCRKSPQAIFIALVTHLCAISAARAQSQIKTLAQAARSSGDAESSADVRPGDVSEWVDRKTSVSVMKDKISGTGFGIFGGADLGLIFSNPSSQLFKSVESSQLGFAPSLKFQGSVFTRRMVLDAGVGLQYARYKGGLLSLPVKDENDVIFFAPVNEPYSYTQTTFLVDTAGRLRINPKVQVGLLGQMLYSSKSAGFASLRDFQPERYIAFLGGQVVYESKLRNYISRVSGSFAVSLTGSNRTVYVGSLGASLGSFLINPVTTVKTQTETKTRTKVKREIIMLDARKADIADNVSFVFDSQMINFQLNSANLSEKSTGFVNALGELFVRERDQWSNIIIEGHTDSRGSEVYNKKLSTMRARSVLAQMEQAGVPREFMEALGRGASQMLISPETSEADYARNRRVEIRIVGLKESRKFREYVEELLEKFFGKSSDRRAAPLPKVEPDANTKLQSPAWDPGIESEGKE